MWTWLLRLVGHRWREMLTLGHVLSPLVLQRLGELVRASEARHSGEIRIVVERGLPLSSLLWHHGSLKQLARERAVQVFAETRVWDTALNNGVLIYLLLAEKAIEIVADRGLNDRVTPEQWHAMVARMSSDFASGRFEEGLTLALTEVSGALEKNFALEAGASNANELPDQPLMR